MRLALIFLRLVQYRGVPALAIKSVPRAPRFEASLSHPTETVLELSTIV